MLKTDDDNEDVEVLNEFNDENGFDDFPSTDQKIHPFHPTIKTPTTSAPKV
jgi:hypothetical protein